MIKKPDPTLNAANQASSAALMLAGLLRSLKDGAVLTKNAVQCLEFVIRDANQAIESMEMKNDLFP